MTHLRRFLLAVAGLALLTPAAGAAIGINPPSVDLTGPDAVYSLLVSASRPDGQVVDLTRAARYRSRNPGVATVSKHGVVSAVGDGSTVIDVLVDGQRCEVAVRARATATPRSYHFVNDV
jgi:hypothetical protein